MGVVEMTERAERERNMLMVLRGFVVGAEHRWVKRNG